MSSKAIDERVVQMQFDNSKFEKNVQESIGTIDKLKKSLNFKDSVNSLDELDKSAEGVSKGFDDVGNSLEGVASKLINLKNMFKFELFSRIAKKVTDVAEKTIKSLSIDPILSGWSKYEEKVTSVQTIMSATASTWEANAKAIGFAGTQMEFVNAQLDKLNWFSDETSFSFTDMTSNIGKFTSAGVDLDKAVTAMEGISVWAAKSGQNAQSASRAYYNLAQAMSVGSVKLMDWKSIENANMATMEFKQTAIDTAEKLKYLKKVEEGVWKTVDGSTVTVTNFNEALKDEWFSAEVLMETLTEYGKAATKLSEIQDKYGESTTVFLSYMDKYNEGSMTIEQVSDKLGISVKELIPLFEELNSEEYKLSMSAFRAAQEAKTFKEVIEATKDAVSTGWMNTWEIIFGNYEEAKRLWSDMAEGFYNIFAEGGNHRNEVLTKVMNSSFDQLKDKINAAGVSTEAFEKRLIEVFKDAGIPIEKMIEQYGSLEEAMKKIVNVKDYVIKAIESFIQPISDGANAILDVTDKLDDFQTVVNKVIRGEFKSGKTRVEKLTEAGYNYALVQGLVNKVWKKNNHTWKDTTITIDDLTEVMSKMSDEELQSMGVTQEQVNMLQELAEQAKESGSELDELLNGLTKKSGRELISDSLLNFIDAINVALDALREAFSEVFTDDAIAKGIYKFLEGLNKLSKWLIMSEDAAGKFKKGLKGVFTIISIVMDLIKAAIKVFFPGFTKGADLAANGIFDIIGLFGDWVQGIKDFLTESDFFVRMMQTIKDAIVAGIDIIKKWIDAFMEIPAVNKAFKTVYDYVSKFINFIKETLEDFKKNMTDGVSTFPEAIAKTFNKVKLAIKNFTDSLPILKKIKKVITDIYEAIKNVFNNISDGFFDGMKSTATTIYDSISKFVKKCLDKINDMLGIHSPSKWFIELVWNCAKGIAQGIIEVATFITNAVSKFVNKVLDKILGIANGNKVKDSFVDTIRDTWKNAGGMREKLVEVFDKVVEYLKAVGSWIKDAVTNIIDYIKSLPKEQLKELLDYILQVVVTIAEIKALFSFASGFKKIGSAFEEIGDAISGFFKGMKNKNMAKTAVMFAVAIAIITACIIALSNLAGPQIDKALEAVGTVIILMGALMIILSFLNILNTKVSKIKLLKGERAGSAGGSIADFGLLILALAASLAIVLHAVKQYTELSSASSTETLQKIIGNMIIFIVSMLALVELFTLLNSRLGKKNIALKAVGTVLALAIGLKLIISTIEKTFFKKDEFGNLVYDADKVAGMAEAFIVVGEMLVVLGGVLALIAAAAGPTGLKGAMTATLGLCIGIIIVVKAIEEVQKYLYSLDEMEFATFFMSYVVILSIILALAGSIALIGKSITNKKTAVGFLAVTLFLATLIGFMFAIAYSIKMIEKIDISSIITFGAALLLNMVALFAGLIVLLSVLKGVVGSSKDRYGKISIMLVVISAFILTIGGFILMLAGAVKMMNEVPILKIIGTLVVIMLSLVAVFVALFAMVTLVNTMTKPQVEKAVKMIYAISALILVIGGVIAAISYFAGENWGTVLAAAGAIAVVIAIVTAVLFLVDKLKMGSIGDVVLLLVALAAAIAIIAYSIYELSKRDVSVIWEIVKAMLILVGVMEAIITIVAYLAQSPEVATAMLIAEAAMGLIAGIALAIGYVIDKLTDLMIVLGIMAYGKDFAEAVAIAFSTRPLDTFGTVMQNTESTVATASQGIANSFGNMLSPIQSVIDKVGELNDTDPSIWLKKSGLWDPENNTFLGMKFGWNGFHPEDNILTSWLGYGGYNKPSEESAIKTRPSNLKEIKSETEAAIKLTRELNELTDEHELKMNSYRLLARLRSEGISLEKEMGINNIHKIDPSIIDNYNKNKIKSANGSPNTQETNSLVDQFYKDTGLSTATVEAAKQSSLDFTNTFVESLGSNFGVEGEGAYDSYLTSIGSKLSDGITSGINIEGLSLDGFEDISVLSDGVGSIIGTDFLTGNTAITDIQNNQGSTNSLLTQLLGKTSQNGTDINTMMGYFKTIAGNSNASAEALSGMGVYLDKSTLVGQILPDVNTGLNLINVGSMRGQYK